MSDKEKLEKYELAFKEVCINYDKCSGELVELRKQGKIKSVKFRETLDRKLILSNIILIFEKYGINK